MSELNSKVAACSLPSWILMSRLMGLVQHSWLKLGWKLVSTTRTHHTTTITNVKTNKWTMKSISVVPFSFSLTRLQFIISPIIQNTISYTFHLYLLCSVNDYLFIQKFTIGYWCFSLMNDSVQTPVVVYLGNCDRSREFNHEIQLNELVMRCPHIHYHTLPPASLLRAPYH